MKHSLSQWCLTSGSGSLGAQSIQIFRLDFDRNEIFHRQPQKYRFSLLFQKNSWFIITMLLHYNCIITNTILFYITVLSYCILFFILILFIFILYLICCIIASFTSMVISLLVQTYGDTRECVELLSDLWPLTSDFCSENILDSETKALISDSTSQWSAFPQIMMLCP